MASKDLTPEERAQRGKRLVLYGMFSLVLVTIIAVFVTLWVVTAPLGPGFTGIPIKVTLIVGIIAVVACVIVWFIYTKAILKE
jgi:peptidoglycan biosynthesis protein MviN/MurJ (putative lipid II flippase)